MSDPTDGGYVNVWSQAGDVPGIVDSDARLNAGAHSYVDTSTDADIYVDFPSTSGQAGWQKGLHFRNAEDLINQLERLKNEGRIKGVGKLAIHAHGLPGRVYINGMKAEPMTGRDEVSKEFVRRLRHLFPPNGGELIFMGCVAAQNSPSFLEHLSSALPNVEIVAFETVGYVDAGAMRRPDSSSLATEPGMRVTPFRGNSQSPGRKEFYDNNWSNLAALPWATRDSQYAAVAINGRIIKHAHSTRIPFEERIPLNQDFPLHKPFPEAQREAEQEGLTVELTDDEAAVFVALPGWQKVSSLQAKPVPHAEVPSKSGLPSYRAEQALSRLSRKLLIMTTSKGGVSGYVRTR